MSAACRHQGVPAEQIDAVVAHYLEGELRGKPSHGVAKFCFESQFFHLRQGPPEVVHQQGPRIFRGAPLGESTNGH